MSYCCYHLAFLTKAITFPLHYYCRQGQCPINPVIEKDPYDNIFFPFVSSFFDLTSLTNPTKYPTQHNVTYIDSPVEINFL